MEFPIVLATGNADKAREITEIFVEVLDRPLAAAVIESLDGHTVGYAVVPVESLGDALATIVRPEQAPDVEETGSTLDENATIKARGVALALGVPAIADDTGLEVDALGGAPGVWSARYAGPDATYADNCTRLLAEMAEVDDARTARFATVARYMAPDGTTLHAVGTVEGTIVRAARGSNGFGYDPLFAPAEGDGRTFAEMSPAEKHAVSHRGRAFRALAEALART